MEPERAKTGIDPQEQADAEAVLRHAFHREPLDPEVARRVHERAARVIEEIRRTHGELDEETINQLLREVRDES
jgi:chorismate mutase